MRLYQHSAKCPAALRTFLDCNPSYWCFTPLRWYEAEEENLNALRQPSGLTRCVVNIVRMGANSDQRVKFCLDNVPMPPARAKFSYRQRQQQRVFFENFLPLPSRYRPYSRIDLHQFSIIAARKQSILISYTAKMISFSQNHIMQFLTKFSSVRIHYQAIVCYSWRN